MFLVQVGALIFALSKPASAAPVKPETVHRLIRGIGERFDIQAGEKVCFSGKRLGGAGRSCRMETSIYRDGRGALILVDGHPLVVTFDPVYQVGRDAGGMLRQGLYQSPDRMIAPQADASGAITRRRGLRTEFVADYHLDDHHFEYGAPIAERQVAVVIELFPNAASDDLSIGRFGYEYETQTGRRLNETCVQAVPEPCAK